MAEMNRWELCAGHISGNGVWKPLEVSEQESGMLTTMLP